MLNVHISLTANAYDTFLIKALPKSSWSLLACRKKIIQKHA